MTNATKGLHRALGRAAVAGATAIADMQPAELLAEMSDEQKSALSAHLASSAPPKGSAADEAAPSSAPQNPAEPPPSDPEPEADAATARVKAVAKAVATDENCKGKGSLALAMLADDDYAGLSANGIIKALGNATAPEASADANEDAARAEMRAAISSSANSNIDADAGNGGKAKAESSAAVWDTAIASVCPDARK
jgi:hypothetical protein